MSHERQQARKPSAALHPLLEVTHQIHRHRDYAASMLRMLNARRAEPQEKRIHQAVLVIVASIEAATYEFMAVRDDDPHDARRLGAHHRPRALLRPWRST